MKIDGNRRSFQLTNTLGYERGAVLLARWQADRIYRAWHPQIGPADQAEYYRGAPGPGHLVKPTQMELWIMKRGRVETSGRLRTLGGASFAP